MNKKIIHLLPALFCFILILPKSNATGERTSVSLTDDQIAKIVIAANQEDIDGGRFAQSKASKEEIKMFAREMVTDHTSGKLKAMKWVGKQNIKPQKSEMSNTMEKNAQDNLVRLKKLSGDDFDHAYVNYEVEMHRKVIQSIDSTLLPNARNTDLRALLQETRTLVEKHLRHAERLQATLTRN